MAAHARVQVHARRALDATDRVVELIWRRIPDLVFWLFMLGTATWLSWLGVGDLKGRLLDGAGVVTRTSIFHISNAQGVSGQAWSAPGLTYDGTPGALIALFEAGAVIFGLLLMRSRRLGRRVGGAMVVVAWAALWAGNAAAFAAKSGGGMNWAMAGAYGLPLVATIIVSMRAMGRGGRGRTRVVWGRLRVPSRRGPGAESTERNRAPEATPRTAEAGLIA